MLKIFTLIVLTAAPATAATYSPEPLQELMIIARGTPCLPEERLDEAFHFGKGVRLPQTCIMEDEPLTPQRLEEALGRPLQPNEFGAALWRDAVSKGVSLFKPVPDPVVETAPVPIPAGVWLLGGALGLLAMTRRKS